MQIIGFGETYEEHLFMQRQYLLDPPVEEGDVSCIERIMRIEMRKARATRLPKYLETYPEFLYLYNYGDNLEHLIKVEKVIEDYSFGHPTLLEEEGACPSEDVGGSRGYEEFLEAWNNPLHPEHERMCEWGTSQRYRELNIPQINKVMESMLKLKKIMSQ
ncbi:hypothetical protein BAOM_4685 [Peribacillus asahii]|uniref:Plasmid pRiA4b Orf3-like domain-containing protein n=1 Tax=Peribacillus asahii TaxID=228899 RepID=A0A3Q9RRZ5_9BACI|nr:plasmid pRiA4b ORF-3 family protein [Peribacillus asahii]AZV45263.1 hypothetical protein BAOM_4685 [Peribacillus asahii]